MWTLRFVTLSTSRDVGALTLSPSPDHGCDEGGHRVSVFCISTLEPKSIIFTFEELRPHKDSKQGVTEGHGRARLLVVQAPGTTRSVPFVPVVRVRFCVSLGSPGVLWVPRR